MQKLYAPFQAPIICVDDPTIAEMVKYASNLFLATTISYWNEIHDVCLRLNISSHSVGKIAALDPRIPSYGASLHGKPFGGRCLPHNLQAFIPFCENLGYDSVLLKAVEEVNKRKRDT